MVYLITKRLKYPLHSNRSAKSKYTLFELTVSEM